MDDDILLKILVVGDPAVGKTSLIQRYANDEFNEDQKTTIGVEFAFKMYELEDRSVNIQLWDIAGQDRFIGLLRTFYRGASAAVVVFDISSSKTLENAGKWKADIDRKVLLPNGKPVPCILVGNKADLRDTKQLPNLITPEEAKEFSTNYGFLGYIETSAKTNQNVARACEGLIKRVLKNRNEDLKKISTAPVENTSKNNVRITASSRRKESSCCS
eukprot:1340440-Amorphochlora_amoeboformis.AAC.1